MSEEDKAAEYLMHSEYARNLLTKVKQAQPWATTAPQHVKILTRFVMMGLCYFESEQGDGNLRYGLTHEGEQWFK
jgi:hypothetical protein